VEFTRSVDGHCRTSIIIKSLGAEDLFGVSSRDQSRLKLAVFLIRKASHAIPSPSRSSIVMAAVRYPEKGFKFDNYQRYIHTKMSSSNRVAEISL